MLLLLPLTLCGLITSVWANTEKVIFLAPGKVNLPDTGPSLAELALDILSPVKSSLRASLPREFGNEPAPDGVQSWYLLNTLHPYKRYEVRVCWPATVRGLIVSLLNWVLLVLLDAVVLTIK